MRRPSVIPGLKNSQRIRVILDGVGVYMTVGDTASQFATTRHQVAVQNTLRLMVLEGCGGMGHTIKVYDERCQAATVQVQVDLM